MNNTPNLTHDALNAAILAHPAEDTPRLVFADLLDEQGESARAEFIRTQIRFASLNEWDEGYTATDVRCRRLLAGHPEWLDRVKVLNCDLVTQCGSLQHNIGCGPHSVFVRGFPGVVAAQAEWFAESCSKLFAQFPIEAAGFVMDCPAQREALLDCPGVGRLLGLGISMWGDEREGWDTLAHFRHLERLERLEVYSEAIVTDTFQTFLESPKFAGLESFSLISDCSDAGRRPADAIREGDRNGWLFGLRDLALDGSEFEGLTQRLARDSGWEPRLTRLRLRGYLGEYGQITPEALAGVGAGLRSGWFAGVTNLDLEQCDFEGLVINSLAASGALRPIRLTLPSRNRHGYQHGLEAKPGLLTTDCLADLRVLRIDRPGDAEVQELINSSLPGSLRVLELPNGTLTGGRLRALLDVPGGWPCLERLNLLGNPIPDGAFKELLALLGRLPRLVSLAIGKGEPMPKYLGRLAESAAASQFRELHMNVPLSDSVAAILANSRHLDHIDLLRVTEGSASGDATARMVSRFGSRLAILPNR